MSEEKKVTGTDEGSKNIPDGVKPEQEQPEQTESPAEPEAENQEVPDTVPEESEAKKESAALPEMSEADALREENFRLRSQLDAIAMGFAPEVIEDAVILAENIVKRDGSDISAALKAVADKYPAWLSGGKKDKGENKKGGFRVGADSSGSDNADTDKLSRIFGIKKKK